MTALADLTEEKLRAMVADGMSASDIAEQYGVSRETFYVHLRRHKLPNIRQIHFEMKIAPRDRPGPSSKLENLSISQYCKMVEAGMTASEIARTYHASRMSLYAFLNRHGVESPRAIRKRLRLGPEKHVIKNKHPGRVPSPLIQKRNEEMVAMRIAGHSYAEIARAFDLEFEAARIAVVRQSAKMLQELTAALDVAANILRK
jgi:DNA-binding CsgD family transcriptional regulator